MQHPFIIQLTSFSHAAPLLALGAMLAGGAALVISSLNPRGQALARRVEMVRLHLTARDAVSATPEEYAFEEGTQGLSVREQRQIARLFRGYGIEPDAAILYFTLLRLGALLLLGGGAFLASSRMSWPLPLLASTTAAIVGWFIPIVAIRIGMKKHRNAVAAGLPDALDLLAICADAGVSLESGLHRVSRELRNTQAALASELALTWAQISIFPNREQALLNLADRIDLPSLRSVVGTLSQSMRYGTPLAQSLRVAALEMRNQSLLQLEERAGRLPALLTFPVMLLILPTIFLIVGGPAVIKILDTLAPH